MQQKPDILYENILFQGLSRHKVNTILGKFKFQKVKKNHILYKPDQPAKFLFIIVTGEFLIYGRKEKKMNRLIARSKTNDIIGEVAILSNKPHSSLVKAAIDSEIIRIKKKDLMELIHTFPELALNLVKIEAGRIRYALNEESKNAKVSKLIAHLNYGSYSSSPIALNIACGMTKCVPHEAIAYLHLSHSKSTPFTLLNFKISENRLLQALDIIRKYKKFDKKQTLFKHKSNLHYLPSARNALAIEILTKKDIPKLFSVLQNDFNYIFVELSCPPKINDQKIVTILRLADQILLGFKNHPIALELIKKDLGILKKTLPNISEKFFLYEDKILLESLDPTKKEKLSFKERLDNILKKLPERVGKRTRRRGVIQNEAKRKAKNKALSVFKMERQIDHKVDFSLTGKIYSFADLVYQKNIMVNLHPEIRLSKNFISLSRWVTDYSIGIAFGGGGARSITQIGAIRVFEEENISFDYIAGTSMGALIGAFFAQGLNSYEVESLFAEMIYEDKAILDYGFPLISFFRGHKIDKLLKNYFKDQRIEDLPIRFSCVAADLISGKEVHFKEGLIWKAVRASLSLPLVLPPIKYNGHYYIDGGALNNVPGSILKEENIKFAFGLNCTPVSDNELKSLLDKTMNFRTQMKGKDFLMKMLDTFNILTTMIKRPPIMAIANRVMMIEGSALLNSKTHYFDYLLNFDTRKYGLFDFHLRDELIDTGHRQTREKIKEIKVILR